MGRRRSEITMPTWFSLPNLGQYTLKLSQAALLLQANQVKPEEKQLLVSLNS